MSKARWGDVVVVGSGRHRGLVGLYDDDDGSGARIIYPETPFVTDYVMVSGRARLRRATTAEAREWRAVHDIQTRVTDRDWPKLALAVGSVWEALRGLDAESRTLAMEQFKFVIEFMVRLTETLVDKGASTASNGRRKP